MRFVHLLPSLVRSRVVARQPQGERYRRPVSAQPRREVPTNVPKKCGRCSEDAMLLLGRDERVAVGLGRPATPMGSVRDLVVPGQASGGMVPLGGIGAVPLRRVPDMTDDARELAQRRHGRQGLNETINGPPAWKSISGFENTDAKISSLPC